MTGKLMFAGTLAGAIALAGCANMTEQDQRVLSGAAIGTAAGVAVGAITGDWAWAAGGAAAGVVGGYISDQRHQRDQRLFNQGVEQGRAQQKK